jgi:SAM-dependent methyltransferase
MLYDPQGVRNYFNDYGMKEWERLERTLQGRIKYAIHRRYLEKYVPAGAHVLDAGCGPGRFALDLARRDAGLTLVDISQTQLDLARQHLDAVGLLDHVQAFHCLDMVDLAILKDASFDAVVCYGAVLSYTYDQYQTALQELARVIRPGGHFLVSVCSLYGTLRLVGPYDEEPFLEAPDSHVEWETILSGGDVAYSRQGSPEFRQPMALFTSAGLRQALEQVGLEVIEMAAVNPVVSEAAQIPRITASEQAAATLTELELALCNQPGLVDTGEHLLAVSDKR